MVGQSRRYNMFWQDVLIMVGCWILGFALIPSILSKGKPARSTCFMSSLILISFTIAFATLGLWLSTVAEAFVAIMWVILLFQRRHL